MQGLRLQHDAMRLDALSRFFPLAIALASEIVRRAMAQYLFRDFHGSGVTHEGAEVGASSRTRHCSGNKIPRKYRGGAPATPASPPAVVVNEAERPKRGDVITYHGIMMDRRWNRRQSPIGCSMSCGTPGHHRKRPETFADGARRR